VLICSIIVVGRIVLEGNNVVDIKTEPFKAVE